MKTIIVTGGAGFIGANFVHFLLSKAKGHRVVVFDKLTYAGNLASLREALRKPNVRFVRGDIADRRKVEWLYKTTRPQYVFNFAAESHVDRSIEGAGDFVQTNLKGAFEMLDGAKRYWSGLRGTARGQFRFLQVSTDEVYGSLGKTGAFSEKTPYAPNSPYSATKAGADHLVRAYHETYGLPVLSTNCSNNYGPFQFPEKLVPLVLLNALEGKTLPIYGDGGNVRDWLFVGDHCVALWLVMRKGEPGEKYNLGGNAEKTNLQVVLEICSQLEKLRPAKGNPALMAKDISRYRDLITFVKDRPGHDRRYAMNIAKIRRELGWKPSLDFGKGMEKTVEWYLGNLDWCRQVQAGNYGRQRLGLLGRKR